MNYDRKILFPIKPFNNFNLVKGVLKVTTANKTTSIVATYTSIKINPTDVIIVIFDDENELCFTLKNNETKSFSSVINVERLVGIIYQVKNTKSRQEIAYFSSLNLTTSEFLHLAKMHIKSPLNNTSEEPTAKEYNDNVEGVYDDEAISTYNYYENENALFNKTDGINQQNYNETQEKSVTNKRGEYETHFNSVESDNLLNDATMRRAKLENLLNKYPPCKELSALLPNSKFSTLNYDSLKEYYVGITTIANVTYACFAVKGYYGKKGPKNSFFIPLSQLNYEGEGYYVSFSSLSSGETIENLLQQT